MIEKFRSIDRKIEGYIMIEKFTLIDRRIYNDREV